MPQCRENEEADGSVDFRLRPRVRIDKKVKFIICVTVCIKLRVGAKGNALDF